MIVIERAGRWKKLLITHVRATWQLHCWLINLVVQALNRMVKMRISLIVHIIFTILRNSIVVLAKRWCWLFVDCIYESWDTSFLVLFCLHLQFLIFLRKLLNLLDHFIILLSHFLYLSFKSLNRFSLVLYLFICLWSLFGDLIPVFPGIIQLVLDALYV